MMNVDLKSSKKNIVHLFISLLSRTTDDEREEFMLLTQPKLCWPEFLLQLHKDFPCHCLFWHAMVLP